MFRSTAAIICTSLEIILATIARQTSLPAAPDKTRPKGSRRRRWALVRSVQKRRHASRKILKADQTDVCSSFVVVVPAAMSLTAARNCCSDLANSLRYCSREAWLVAWEDPGAAACCAWGRCGASAGALRRRCTRREL